MGMKLDRYTKLNQRSLIKPFELSPLASRPAKGPDWLKGILVYQLFRRLLSGLQRTLSNVAGGGRRRVMIADAVGSRISLPIGVSFQHLCRCQDFRARD